jgi:hypothetical protein
LSLEDALGSLGAAVSAILAARNVLPQPIVPLEQILKTETGVADDDDEDDDDEEGED